MRGAYGTDWFPASTEMGSPARRYDGSVSIRPSLHIIELPNVSLEGTLREARKTGGVALRGRLPLQAGTAA
jgi:hypothetical protein